MNKEIYTLSVTNDAWTAYIAYRAGWYLLTNESSLYDVYTGYGNSYRPTSPATKEHETLKPLGKAVIWLDEQSSIWARIVTTASGKITISWHANHKPDYKDTVTLTASDIEIGAVEIKDATTDTRATVEADGADNALLVKSNSLATEVTAAAILVALDEDTGDVPVFIPTMQNGNTLAWIATEANTAKNAEIVPTWPSKVIKIRVVRTASGGTQHTGYIVELFEGAVLTNPFLLYRNTVTAVAAGAQVIVLEIPIAGIFLDSAHLTIQVTPSGGDATTTATLAFTLAVEKAGVTFVPP